MPGKPGVACNIMTASMDAFVGTECFSGNNGELKLVQANVNQQLEQIKDMKRERRELL
jgi:hypothetical protein